MTRTCIIFNPAAQGEGARRFRERLAALSEVCALKPTLAPGAARILADEAVREGFQTIVAAGGDGTVNEVVNGIADAPEGFARARLGVLPLGTANVFARELRLPRKVGAAWEIIQNGRESLIDLGQADFAENGRAQRRFFAQMAGAGFDSRVIDLASWELKKKIGALSYFFAAWRAWRETQPEIVAEAGEIKLTAQLVLIGNGRFYGGSFRVFPFADLQDGLLDVTVFRTVHLAAMFRAYCSLLCNRLGKWGGTRHFQTEELRLSSAQPAGFHVEGENAGLLPVRISVARRALRVLVP